MITVDLEIAFIWASSFLFLAVALTPGEAPESDRVDVWGLILCVVGITLAIPMGILLPILIRVFYP